MIISSDDVKVFDGYVVASTNFVYTSGGLAGAGDGWESANYDKKWLVYGVSSLDATTLTIRVEGRGTHYDRAASLCIAQETAVTNIDKVIELDEAVDEVRVGVKLDAVASPTGNIVYAGLFRQERR